MSTKTRPDIFILKEMTEGAHVWAVYGAVECWAATVLPKVLLPWSPGPQDGNISLSVVVLVIYTLLGGLLGAALGSLLGSVDQCRSLVRSVGAEKALRTGATITLVAVCA